jgi:diguanylate cyclase (GGDEF)-like protein/PAS domain S-box-containing protein
LPEDTSRALREAEAKYRTLVEQIPAIVYTAEFGAAGRWTFVSPQIESLLGYTPEEWIADPSLWYERLHPEDRDRAMEEEERSRSTHVLCSEYRMVARDGRVVWFRDEARIVTADGQDVLMQGVLYDVTLRKEAEAELTYLAYHDKLTGLPNRQMFAELLELAVARAKRHDLSVAVLYMDLDTFKVINDTLGHAAGDKLLQQASMRLREAIRDVDVVARQGGDEFLLLLADLPRIGSRMEQSPRVAAESVAARVIECFARPFYLGGMEVFSTASIGIALYPESGDSPETLLKRADAAMYESKHAGPGQFVLHTDQESASSRLSLTTRLRRAVESRQWVLHYQPVIELATGRMTGVEALIRWRTPQGGLIAPGEFIPLAEELGLIAAIGDWVLGEVAEQWRRWRDGGLIVRASLNLSPRQLRQPNLVERIMQQLSAHDVDPSMIVIEITESAAMVDPDRTQHVFEELRRLGVGLAIDDFGTGYSSLSRLRHMPVDTLKIDRSFVAEVPGDPETSAMVAAFIQLAHNLRIVPLAEGIENEEQLEFLRASGCTLGQGFLFAQPIEPDELVARFAPASAH